jgi:hypothetical protein
MLVRHARQGEDLADLARRWVSLRKVYQPSEEHAEWYRNRFAVYETLYPQLRTIIDHPTFRA